MARGGPGSYGLRMNDSEVEAEIHTLRDGGLLMQASHYNSLIKLWYFDVFLLLIINTFSFHQLTIISI